jgi:hypothetical protein
MNFKLLKVMNLGRDIIRKVRHSRDTRIFDHLTRIGPDNYEFEYDDDLMEFIRSHLTPKKTESVESYVPLFEIPNDIPNPNMAHDIMSKREYYGSALHLNVVQYLEIFLDHILSPSFTPRIFDYTHVIATRGDTDILVLRCPTPNDDDSYALTFDLTLLRCYLVDREISRLNNILEDTTRTIVVNLAKIAVVGAVFIALRLLFQ